MFEVVHHRTKRHKLDAKLILSTVIARLVRPVPFQTPTSIVTHKAQLFRLTIKDQLRNAIVDPCHYISHACMLEYCTCSLPLWGKYVIPHSLCLPP